MLFRPSTKRRRSHLGRKGAGGFCTCGKTQNILKKVEKVYIFLNFVLCKTHHIQPSTWLNTDVFFPATLHPRVNFCQGHIFLQRFFRMHLFPEKHSIIAFRCCKVGLSGLGSKTLPAKGEKACT